MSSAAAATMRSALLIEDDADTRDVMSKMLRDAGFDVRSTSHVGEALLFLENSTPSHVLLDLMLPDAGGIVILRSIRRRQLPIKVAVVTAADPTSQSVTDVRRWNPDAIFFKPIVLRDVDEWLQQPRSSSVR